jgi:HNH endonuclease
VTGSRTGVASGYWTVMATPAQPDRATRLRAAAARDGDGCVWCGRPCTGLVRATTDHLVPKVKGGPSWLENEVAACGRCNSARGHTGPVEWLEECERRGWRPDEERLHRALTSLAEAIAREGGQRRARPYLAAQLRRLRRRHGPASGTGAARRSVVS